MDNWGQRMLIMAVVWAVPCASIWTIISLLFWAFSYSGTGNAADSLLYKIGTAIEPVTHGLIEILPPPGWISMHSNDIMRRKEPI